MEIAWYHVSGGKGRKKGERKGSSSGGARRRLFLFPYNLAVVDGSFAEGQDARMPCKDREEFVAGVL